MRLPPQLPLPGPASHPAGRRPLPVLLALLALLAPTTGAAPATAAPATAHAPAPPVVVHARLESIIQPVAAQFLRGVLARADAAGAAGVVGGLDTPGGVGA